MEVQFKNYIFYSKIKPLGMGKITTVTSASQYFVVSFLPTIIWKYLNIVILLFSYIMDAHHDFVVAKDDKKSKLQDMSLHVLKKLTPLLRALSLVHKPSKSAEFAVQYLSLVHKGKKKPALDLHTYLIQQCKWSYYVDIILDKHSVKFPIVIGNQYSEVTRKNFFVNFNGVDGIILLLIYRNGC
jgi:hypothetical protein